MNLEKINLQEIDLIDGDFFESLGDGENIVYCTTNDVENAFKTTSKHKILITHNSDRNITKLLVNAFLDCKKYDIWFALNVLFLDSRLIPLPIGFERSRWCTFSKFEIIKSLSNAYAPTKKLYGNFSLYTNKKLRENCLLEFINKKYFTNRVVLKLPHPKLLTLDLYILFCKEILDHLFILCPEGHGIDTHRFWETLALGRIPVVLHNVINDYFSTLLPILVLNKWSDFELESLKFLNKNNLITSNYNIMTFSYWKNKLKNYI